MRSETKYQALAKERTASALRGRDFNEASTTLSTNAARLLKWRRVDRKYAARALGWAEAAVRAYCG